MSSSQFQQPDSFKEEIPWYYSKTFVWILLLSIGPLGLPWLFKSPKFTRVSKGIITLLILILTALPFYLGYLFHRMLENPGDLTAFLNLFFNAEDSQLILDLLRLFN